MAKGKLAKFADMATYKNVFQYPYSVVEHVPFDMKGHWHEQYFHNDNPIILELGCGKGEYAVNLAKLYPDKNFIGVDIKGARMWTGATQALNEGLENVAFLRTNIEIIDRFFAAGEVSEIWLTFSDPQMKNPRKRLTSTYFMERYRKFLVDDGIIHLKTDSNFLFTYTRLMVEHNNLPKLVCTEDLYNSAECRVQNAECPDAALLSPSARDCSAVLGDSIAELDRKILSIQTYYESQWIARGLSIKYLKFTLPHSAPLSESEVEIPLDEYRSYHRGKRSGLETAK